MAEKDASSKPRHPPTRAAQLEAQLQALKSEEQTLQSILMQLHNRKRQLLIEEERLRGIEERQEDQPGTSYQ